MTNIDGKTDKSTMSIPHGTADLMMIKISKSWTAVTLADPAGTDCIDVKKGSAKLVIVGRDSKGMSFGR